MGLDADLANNIVRTAPTAEGTASMKNNIAVVTTVPEIPTALAIPDEARIDTITGIHDVVILVIVESGFNFSSGSSWWILCLAVFAINPIVRNISATRHNIMYVLCGIFVS